MTIYCTNPFGSSCLSESDGECLRGVSVWQSISGALRSDLPNCPWAVACPDDDADRLEIINNMRDVLRAAANLVTLYRSELDRCGEPNA